MSKYRTFTAEFKAPIVMAVLTGDQTVAAVCRQHQLSDTLFYRGKADLRAGLPRIFDPDPQLAAAQARVADRERLVGRLTLELEVAKKALPGLPSTTRKNGASR
jgi:transposase-like protein